MALSEWCGLTNRDHDFIFIFLLIMQMMRAQFYMLFKQFSWFSFLPVNHSGLSQAYQTEVLSVIAN
jgi:hypothetical protein